MQAEQPASPKIFLLTTELPVNLLMTRNAVCAATQIAELLSFTEKNKYDLEVAVEEGFSNAVQHFSKESVEEERIYIEFTIEEGYLVTSIRENGIPFDMNESERFTPETLESMERPGLGTFLMEQSMDSVEYFVHGRDGKETRLKKRINNTTIPEQLVPTKTRRRSKIRPTVKESISRKATKSDLPEICRLAWKCYGYTQEELLYNLDLLTEKFEEGLVVPIVTFDADSGNLIAHQALKYHDPITRVSELGLAFIDPSYRCPNLSKKFAADALRIAESHGDKGMFDCSVTTHIYSQRAIQDYVGSGPCGVMLAIAATGMEAKELTTTKQEKGTIVNHYYAFDRSIGTIYPPLHHKDMITKIYKWLKVPRNIEESADCTPAGESGISVFPLPDELNVSFIVVHKIGEETLGSVQSGLRQCKSEHRDAVYIFIPLGVACSPYLVENCEKLGFSFAGIMPHIHDGDDRIILQWVNISIDPAKIKVYGAKSAELLSYIISEKERVEGL